MSLLFSASVHSPVTIMPEAGVALARVNLSKDIKAASASHKKSSHSRNCLIFNVGAEGFEPPTLCL